MSDEFNSLKAVIGSLVNAVAALEAKIVPTPAPDPSPADITALTATVQAALDQANAKLNPPASPAEPAPASV